MKSIERACHAKVNKLLQNFPCVLIVGVRQSGKTFLAKQLRPKWQYFDLAKSSDARYIQRDYDFFFSQHPSSIVFDEAQLQPELFRHLRGVIDSQRSKKNRFILTGSSSPELIHTASDSLAGRVGIVELGTFKLSESLGRELSPFYRIFNKSLGLQTARNLCRVFKNWPSLDVWPFFLKGGYPEPTLSRKKDFFSMWMNNYCQTYIHRDVKSLYPRLDNTKYQSFFNMLSDMSGTIVNRAQLGRSLSLSESSVREYLDLAHNTYVWRKIPAYTHTAERSLAKMPKGIVRDSGLCHFLSDILTKPQLLRSRKLGQSFEAFVVEEILKGLEASLMNRWTYYYYRTKNGVEIDLILEGAFGVLPIEIKVGTHIHPAKLNNLQKFVERHKLPLGLVINNASECKMIAPKILQLPVHCI